VLRAAVGLFLTASVLCAFAPSIPLFTAARFLQGMGGAIMIPVCRLALLRGARKDQIVTAMGWLITPALLGPLLGPPIGGLIVTHLNWRWIFYLNVPIGLVGIVLMSLFIDDTKSRVRQKLDRLGFLLSALALGCLLFGFEGASRVGGEGQAALLIVLGLVAGAGYFAHARRTEHPVLDFGLLSDRSFRLSMAAGSLTRITQGAQTFLLPLLFQVGLGLSAAASGLLILFLAVGALGAKMVVTRVLKRLGFRNSMILNGLAVSLCYGACGLFRHGWPEPAMVGVLLLSGFFMSLQFSAYNSIAYEHIDHARLSAATSFYATFQQMLLSMGVCTGALTLRLSMAAQGRGAPTPIDFTAAFAVVCGVTALATFAHLRFPRDAGAVLSGRARTQAQTQ
jgi:MFS family permease